MRVHSQQIVTNEPNIAATPAGATVEGPPAEVVQTAAEERYVMDGFMDTIGWIVVPFLCMFALIGGLLLLEDSDIVRTHQRLTIVQSPISDAEQARLQGD